MKFSVEEARDRMLSRAHGPGRTEEVALAQARGRVLARDVLAPADVPARACSQMDGYALRAQDGVPGGAGLPVRQRVAAGDVPGALARGEAARIFTGAVLPAGADAVLPQEEATIEEGRLLVRAAVRPGQWVRPAASEMRSGEVVLAAGCALRAPQLALAASTGHDRLQVCAPPRVSLFCTGSELVEPGEPLPEGKVYNSNRVLLAALLRDLGCEVRDLGIIRDDLALTRATLREAARGSDLVLSSGGVSVGEEDHVRAALEAEGRVELWQIAMKPGKPLVFGEVGGTPFIGLPGNPVSGFVTFSLLVRPFLLRSMGVADVAPAPILLRSAFSRAAGSPRREFLRARAAPDGTVSIHADQSAAVLASVAWAQGLVDAPAGEAIAPGDPVRYIALGAITGAV